MDKGNQSYTKINNDLLDNLCMIRISGQARQVLDVIFRKTYGFNKESDRIALSQFVKFTGLKKQTVCKVINILKSLNLIIVTQKGNTIKDNTYRINENYKSWHPLPKKVTLKSLPKKVTSVTQKGYKSLPKMVHTKDNDTKETIQKAGPNLKAKKNSKLAGPESEQARLIQSIIEEFCFINPAMKRMYGNVNQRLACVNLIETYGYEITINIIKKILPQSNRKAYMPTITTPYQLFDKWKTLESTLIKYKETLNLNKPKGNETII